MGEQPGGGSWVKFGVWERASLTGRCAFKSGLFVAIDWPAKIEATLCSVFASVYLSTRAGC